MPAEVAGPGRPSGRRIWRFALAALMTGVALAACATAPPPATEPVLPAVSAPVVQESAPVSSPAGVCIPFEPPSPDSPDFSPERVARLEGFASSDASSESKAEARLRLARIFLHRENPRADLGRAVRELTAYQELLPEPGADPEARNLLEALRLLVRQKAETELMRSEAERQKAESLRAGREIETCRADLRKLREVDIWLEKQKRGIP